MKQSSAPLYRGWYGCDLVKFGEMLTASRTCAVGIGVLLTDLTGTFSRNDESANGNLDINENGVMLTNRMRIKLPRHPPTMSPVFTPSKYAPLYHALLANGNIHLFVSTNHSSPPISWPITARLRFKPRRLGCDPREPGSAHRRAHWNMIQAPARDLVTLFVIMKLRSINPSPG